MADTDGGEFESSPCANPIPILVIRALQQHANPLAFETVPATLVERGRNVTKLCAINISYGKTLREDSRLMLHQ